MNDNGYAAACTAAVTQQGLDPVIERLYLETIHYEVEQTGGFCMVVIVPTPDGVYGITADTLDPKYLLCWYENDDWQEGRGEAAFWEEQTLDQVVEHLRSGT
jgi:hypothetical protein